MKKTRAALALIVIILLPASAALGETASIGFRFAYNTWRERDLFDSTKKASGVDYGPTLLYRLGEKENWSIGLEGFYGEFDELNRAEVDVIVGYRISPLFTVFADLKYYGYRYDGRNEADVGEKIKTNAFGGGVGVDFQAPLGQGGPFFIFLNTRLLPMSLRTDVEGGDGTGLLWAYEAGLAYATYLGIEPYDLSLYIAAGYRRQQVKSSKFNETLDSPFVEIGFKQEF